MIHTELKNMIAVGYGKGGLGHGDVAMVHADDDVGHIGTVGIVMLL